VNAAPSPGDVGNGVRCPHDSGRITVVPTSGVDHNTIAAAASSEAKHIVHPACESQIKFRHLVRPTLNSQVHALSVLCSDKVMDGGLRIHLKAYESFSDIEYYTFLPHF
jgi:hypothetical protein